MQSDNSLNINLDKAAYAAEPINIELKSDFFADLEQEEIIGGTIHANILVHSVTNDLYSIDIKINGSVTVRCDRCLDPLEMGVDTEDQIKVKNGMFDDSSNAELCYTNNFNSLYDISWDIYEIVETSLPTQRVHKLGQCNQEMLSFILDAD